MFRLMENVFSRQQVDELRSIAKGAKFVDGKISNPHSKAKNNLHLHDQKAHQRSSQLLASALVAHEDFRNYTFPAQLAPPLLTRYEAGMHYGLHPDSALMILGNTTIRSDVSCTVFLNDPKNYEGGALRIQLGTESVRIKGPAGSVVAYTSSTLHEVEKVTAGERLVGITFLQSQVSDPLKRELLYELNEVAALEGLGMSHENFTRLQSVQFNLMRMWGNP